MAEPTPARTPDWAALRTAWHRLPPARRVAFACALAGMLLLPIGVLAWRAPADAVLFAGITPADAAAITQILEQRGIPYRQQPAGTLRVPAAQVLTARLQVTTHSLPRGVVAVSDTPAPARGRSQQQESAHAQRALEAELARTIQAIGAIAQARVHIALPAPSVFSRRESQPSASVLLTLQPGRQLAPEQIGAIVHLVSASVPQLTASQISVVDQHGTALATPVTGHSSGQGPQLQYVRQLEAAVAERLASVLRPVLGAGNFGVQVAADVDFSRHAETQERFTPNAESSAQTLRAHQLTEAPGSRQETRNYEVSRSVRHTETHPGTLRRLSAAVILNRPAKTTGRDGMDSAQWRALAEQAMGFDSRRGDTLTVTTAPFAATPAAPAPPPFYQDADLRALAYELAVWLGLLGLCLLLYRQVLRPLSKTLFPVAPVPADTAHPGEPARALAATTRAREDSLEPRLAALRANPQAVAAVIKTWVSPEHG